MCTGIEKLRRASDQVAIERTQERTELIQARKELVKAVREKESSEMDAQDTRSRNMLLARNADMSNMWMCASLMVSFVLLGLLVYCWP